MIGKSGLQRCRGILPACGPRTQGGQSRMDDPEIIELTPQPTAAIRITQPMAALDLASAFDQGMPLVASRIAETGGSIAGPPYGGESSCLSGGRGREGGV